MASFGFVVAVTASVVALFFSPLHALAIGVIALNFGLAAYGQAGLTAFSIYARHVIGRDKSEAKTRSNS